MIVQQARRRKQANELPASPGINRVDKLTILGVTVSNTFAFNYHVTALIEETTRAFYAFKTLRVHGLMREALWDAAHAAVISQLLYETPAWCGYPKSDKKSDSNLFLTKHSATVACQLHA